MKTLTRIVPFGVLALLLMGGARAEPSDQLITYGIEFRGKLCGYSQYRVSDVERDGVELLVLEQKKYMMLSLLGAEFDAELDLTYHIDRATGRFVYHDAHIRQGDLDSRVAMFIENDTARITSPEDDEVAIVELPSEGVLPNTLHFPHLYEDFVEAGLPTKTYAVFEVREGAMQPVTYTKVGEERLELSGRTHDTIILREENARTGVRIQRWLDRANGHVVKTVQPNGMVTTLADESVVGRIELANLDESILVRTNAMIRDVARIRFMRVKALLEPTGLRPTPDSLNIPGQSFEGTVQGNRIEGVFEISHPLYDGADAPSFPPLWNEREDLAPFLEAEAFIESDDPVLADAAREIVEGAADSWDAARRIARWVSENIRGALPGGVTARNTYDTRSGECGAHSFLTAALCRAVGIPARAVWGCMYVPLHGGVFGQHVWNEVYMGDAGWIPLDTTAQQSDFVDSGHIRVGIFQSKSTALNGESFDVLDHLLGDD